MQVSDTLFARNGNCIIINSISSKDTLVQVYNLTVANNNNFFVGADQVLVHNDCMLNTLLAPKYEGLVNKVNELTDLKGTFMADFEKAGTEVLDVLNNKNGLESWVILRTQKGVAPSIEEIAQVQSYLNTEGKTVENVTKEITEAGGYENWVKSVVKTGSKLDFATMDLPNALQHVKFRDGLGRTIDGCHDAVEFAKVRQVNAIGNPNYQVAIGKTLDEVEEIVIVGTRNSTTSGVKIVDYKIPALDRAQKTTGALSAKTYSKTIYDPAIWTDAKLEKALKEALQDAANKNNGTIMREWEGISTDGYKMRGYFENGKVTSFFFD